MQVALDGTLNLEIGRETTYIHDMIAQNATS